MIKNKKLEKYDNVKNKYTIIEIDGKLIKNDRNLRKLFDDILKLPEYCGSSMDSVHDCFYDEKWTKNKKVILLIKNLKAFESPQGLVRIFSDIVKNSQKKDSNFEFKFVIF